MNTNSIGIEHLMDVPIIGIVRNMPSSEFADILPVYYEAGLKVIEVTMNTAGSSDMIRYAIKHYGDKLTIGAGTVITQTDLHNALEAGARFIITPILNEEVIDECIKRDIPIIPGAFSPTEIYKASAMGASLIKLFPATSLGVQYVKDIKAVLNNVALMPTGGIDHKNITTFFQAGATAVGIGNKLFDQAMIRGKNWNGLINHFITFARAVSSFRTSPL